MVFKGLNLKLRLPRRKRPGPRDSEVLVVVPLLLLEVVSGYLQAYPSGFEVRGPSEGRDKFIEPLLTSVTTHRDQSNAGARVSKSLP